MLINTKVSYAGQGIDEVDFESATSAIPTRRRAMLLQRSYSITYKQPWQVFFHFIHGEAKVKTIHLNIPWRLNIHFSGRLICHLNKFQESHHIIQIINKKLYDVEKERRLLYYRSSVKREQRNTLRVCLNARKAGQLK